MYSLRIELAFDLEDIREKVSASGHDDKAASVEHRSESASRGED